VASGGDINPFTNVTITDGNPYVSDTTLTISLLGADGTPTDANGTLTLPADDLAGDTFTETSPGVYVLVDTSAPSPIEGLPHFQPQLSDMTFIPSGAATTSFSLAVNDVYNEHQTDTTTTVTASGARQ
jgi:hypothetical protein